MEINEFSLFIILFFILTVKKMQHLAFITINTGNSLPIYHISQCEELKIEEQHVFLIVSKKY